MVAEEHMTLAEQLFEQAKLLPEPLAQEALDFVRFLRERNERGEWRNLMDSQSAALADVWDNPVPFSDLSSTKRCPVLSLTAPDSLGDFVACPVTSRDVRHHALQLAATDLSDGMLPLVSWVRTDRVVTLHTALVLKQIGRVTEAFRTNVASDVCRFIRAGHGT
jgi:mRNA-degrading endonuclease toxin of MazEF toxin-antitoxin module